jgi:hypothetical protein
MGSDDQEKIRIVRYFIRADQRRSDVLELFREDTEKSIFLSSDWDSDETLFLKWLRDSKACWN